MPMIIRKSISSSSSPAEKQHTILHAIGWSHLHASFNVWSPPTDMYENDDDYVVRVEIAGMREEDITVSVEENNHLIVSGIRPDLPERRAYHQMEIRFGKFMSTVSLPGLVDMDRVVAEYTNGFLLVTLPKKQPSRISIQEKKI
ncbi:MAG: Hsp20/alpha crystallin family protein [Anaerolineales bacterium]|nr:Hsp20/alpha crystallin family protein [Anaerolineales bacterium]